MKLKLVRNDSPTARERRLIADHGERREVERRPRRTDPFRAQSIAIGSSEHAGVKRTIQLVEAGVNTAARRSRELYTEGRNAFA